MNNLFNTYYPKKQQQQQYKNPLDTNTALSSYTKIKPIVDNGSSGVKQTFLEDYSSIQSNINKLFESKYGLGNYDINKGWYNQQAKPLSTWSDVNEVNALSQYEKLGTDFNNANLGINAYNTFKQNQAQNQGENAIFREQAEKYVPQQLQMQGLGQVGSSEIPIGSIERSYLNRYNDINQDVENQANSMLNDYTQAQKGSQLSLEKQNYDAELAKQDAYYTDFNNNLATIETKGGFLMMLEEAKKVLSNDQYNALYQNALKVAKELGYDLTVDETKVIPSYAIFDPNDAVFEGYLSASIGATPNPTISPEKAKKPTKPIKKTQGGLIRKLEDYSMN